MNITLPSVKDAKIIDKLEGFDFHMIIFKYQGKQIQLKFDVEKNSEKRYNKMFVSYKDKKAILTSCLVDEIQVIDFLYPDYLRDWFRVLFDSDNSKDDDSEGSKEDDEYDSYSYSYSEDEDDEPPKKESSKKESDTKPSNELKPDEEKSESKDSKLESKDSKLESKDSKSSDGLQIGEKEEIVLKSESILKSKESEESDVVPFDIHKLDDDDIALCIETDDEDIDDTKYWTEFEDEDVTYKVYFGSVNEPNVYLEIYEKDILRFTVSENRALKNEKLQKWYLFMNQVKLRYFEMVNNMYQNHICEIRKVYHLPL